MPEIKLNPCPWCGNKLDSRGGHELGCGYPLHLDEMNAALDVQRQEITAEIEAAHLEREMALAADLDNARAEISALKDLRQAMEEELDRTLPVCVYNMELSYENSELHGKIRCAEEQRDSATAIHEQVRVRLGETLATIRTIQARVKELEGELALTQLALANACPPVVSTHSSSGEGVEYRPDATTGAVLADDNTGGTKEQNHG